MQRRTNGRETSRACSTARAQLRASVRTKHIDTDLVDLLDL